MSLTSSDRLWMDQVVKAVEETWNPVSLIYSAPHHMGVGLPFFDTFCQADPTRPIGLVYRGSDDDLRNRFEEYICSALATLKYQDFLASGQTGIPIMPGGEQNDHCTVRCPELRLTVLAHRFPQSCESTWRSLSRSNGLKRSKRLILTRFGMKPLMSCCLIFASRGKRGQLQRFWRINAHLTLLHILQTSV